MKNTVEKKKIEELLELKNNSMLTVNPEYQRGEVWNSTLQKKLIDSVLRGYPLPLIYLHHKKRNVSGMTRDDLEIIDGQQRIRAFELFIAGALTLFDPEKDDKVARFPKFVKQQPCPWARKTYDDLPIDLQKQFNETEISIAKIETENDDEARDLFIRLQSGLPLNSQEKRDAWPGGFTEFILKIGGKANNIKFPGNTFFKELVKKNKIDRGTIRQLAAQISMLFFEKATNDNWRDIGSPEIDDYYYTNLGFDNASPEVKRFKAIFDKIYNLFVGRGSSNLKGHEAIHLVLLVDRLMNDYTPSWESKLQPAFEDFRKESINAKRNQEGEYWTHYVQWINTNSDTAKALATRHNFFSNKMYEKINPQLLDTNRVYGSLERQIIYYRDNKRCAVCSSDIAWDDLEIHHIKEHQYGGQTTLENGISVHSSCHPKGNRAVEFEERFLREKERKENSSKDIEKQISIENALYFYYDSNRCIRAFGKYTSDINDNEFTVLKDSIISNKIDDSFGGNSATDKAFNLRNELESKSIIIDKTFKEDYIFNSVSLAAKVVCGGSRDGTQWKKVNN